MRHLKRYLGLYIGLFVIIIMMILGTLWVRARKVRVSLAFSYRESFLEFFEDMKERYVLTKHKNIDWKALEDKYVPLMEEADKNQDESIYLNALLDFSLEFHDSHIILEDIGDYASMASTSNLEECKKTRFPSCYDMAVLRLEDGRYVAVNVTKDGVASMAGIEELDIITAWNGRPIEEAVEDITDNIPLYRWNYANGENEAYFKPLYLSCQSEDVVIVSIEGKGDIKMKSSGNGYDYLTGTFKKLYCRVNQGIYMDHSKDMMWYSVDDNYIYMCVAELKEDSGKEFEEEIGQMILDIEANHPDYLLLDFRNNSGGYDDRGADLLSYFISEDKTYLVENTYSLEKNEFVPQRTIRVEAKDMIHLPIILLINSQCVSAGEAFIYHMSQLSNVTIVGANPTNGSLSTYEGFHVLPGGVALHFPHLACMSEDGKILIDSDERGIGGIEPDVIIPTDEDFVRYMFDDDLNIDYERMYATSLR